MDNLIIGLIVVLALAYLAVRLIPSALFEPSQLQLPPQLEDFLEPPLPQPQPPLPDTCL